MRGGRGRGGQEDARDAVGAARASCSRPSSQSSVVAHRLSPSPIWPVPRVTVVSPAPTTRRPHPPPPPPTRDRRIHPVTRRVHTHPHRLRIPPPHHAFLSVSYFPLLPSRLTLPARTHVARPLLSPPTRTLTSTFASLPSHLTLAGRAHVSPHVPTSRLYDFTSPLSHHRLRRYTCYGGRNSLPYRSRFSQLQTYMARISGPLPSCTSHVTVSRCTVLTYDSWVLSHVEHPEFVPRLHSDVSSLSQQRTPP